MAFDHRRILATAMGRLRGKLKYRPVVFELLPPEFTLLDLQKTVEAISGTLLHKQNFRRLVEQGGLVETTGNVSTETGGRPAKLYRFRREVVLERPAPGLRVKSGRAPAIGSELSQLARGATGRANASNQSPDISSRSLFERWYWLLLLPVAAVLIFLAQPGLPRTRFRYQARDGQGRDSRQGARSSLGSRFSARRRDAGHREVRQASPRRQRRQRVGAARRRA